MNDEPRTRRIFNFTLALTIALAFLLGFQSAGLMNLMSTQDKLPTWISRAASGLSYSAQAAPPGFTEGEMGVLYEVLTHISQAYFYRDSVDNQEVVYGASSGAVMSLGDRYSRFIPPADQRLLTEEIEGEYAGVGISIIDRPGLFPPLALECEIESGVDPEDILYLREMRGVHVVQVFENGPAFPAGVESDDVIACVDGQPLRGAMATEAADLIKGPEGTQVTIVMWRPSLQEEFTFDLTRQVVQVPTVGASEMLTDQVGYIRLDSFNNLTPHDAAVAVNDLLLKGMKGLIFDLRNNTGGPMTAAIGVSDLFVPDGVLVSYEDSLGRREQFGSDDGGDAVGIPLVVLVNGNTASSSEIVAGAIRDTHNGVLLGETTFGKGFVQNVFTLHDGSGLVLTTGRYLTPNGGEITQDGIEPDIVSDLDPERLRQEDPEVDAFLKQIESLNVQYTQLREQMFDYLQSHDFQRDNALDVMSQWLESGQPPAIQDAGTQASDAATSDKSDEEPMNDGSSE